MQDPDSPSGQPADPDSSANKPESDQSLTIEWLLGLLLVLILVGIGAFVLLTLGSNLLGQGAPTPTRRAAATLPLPSPSVTLAPRTSTPAPAPTPTPSPIPSPLPEPALLFLSLTEDPDLSMHFETNARVQAGKLSVSVSMTLDHSGPDMAFDMAVTGTGEDLDFQAVVKDGTAYFRQDRGGWFATDDLSLIDLPATALAFSQLKTEGTQYLGLEVNGDTTLHHLRVPSVAAAGVDPAQLRRFGCDTDNLAMDIWVSDDGTPVTGSFEYSCMVISGGGVANLTASATYEFSNVGQPIKIRPPKRFQRLS